MDILLLILRALLTILLYSFLATVLVALWRDLRRPETSADPVRPTGQLTVVQSESKVLIEGATFPLEGTTSIGRSPSNTLPITDPYTSTLHALLTWREGRWWIEDRGSRNGTWLNDVRVRTPTTVNAGDVIRVGRTHFALNDVDRPGKEEGEATSGE